MNSFLKSILTLSVIAGISSSIISSTLIKKYVNYFISLIMVLIIISPLFNFLSSLDNIKEYVEDFKHSIRTEEILSSSNELIVSSTEKSVCDGIKELILTKFGFDENDVYVSLECDKSNISSIKIKAVNITLTNKASWSDTDAVKDYLDKMIGCKINVKRR